MYVYSNFNHIKLSRIFLNFNINFVRKGEMDSSHYFFLIIKYPQIWLVVDWSNVNISVGKTLITTDSGGARGVMVIVVGNGHGDTSSNPWPG